ncbi:glutathione S-transferase family protein [Falsiroseomonas sp.]|jgi:glutathione S-transferase|uniref:glutathione S-transferase family protein n=1 Tax=Falsiroseomonas sp. TaxID=2870721 RepID=UPI003F724C7E
MLRIWGRATSSNVMKLLWLCDELGLAFGRVDVGGPFGGTREASYLAKNPNALVPVIEDADGFVLWESNACLRYLARSRAPGHPVYPADLRAAADCDRWMDWQQTALNPPLVTVYFTLFRIPEAERDWQAFNAAKAQVEGLFGMLDDRLAGREFLCGDALTLADIALGIYAYRWLLLPIERQEMPHLRRWHDALAARPGFQRYVALPLS